MVPGWHRGKERYKSRGEVGTDAMRAVGPLNSTYKCGESRATERSATEWVGESSGRRWLGETGKREE